MAFQDKISKEFFDRIVKASHHIACYGELSDDYRIDNLELTGLKEKLGWKLLLGREHRSPIYGAHMVFLARPGRPYMRFDVDGNGDILISSLIPHTRMFRVVKIPTAMSTHCEFKTLQYLAEEAIREELTKVLTQVGITICK